MRSLKRLALVCVIATATWPVKGQDRPFDLLIRNGHVIDPGNGIDAVMDVAIAGGKIASVSRSIDPSRAGRVADATGLYVVPGLIDLHAHVFYGTEDNAYLSNSFTAVPPDSHSFRSGQTTLVDVGGAGWRNFIQFKEQVIDRSRTRVLSFINIVGSGMKGGPVEQDLADMNAKLTAMRIRQFPELIVGIKVAHYSGPEWDPVTRAVEAGRETNVPVMIDFGGHTPPLALEDLLLKHLRPGDILTHAYADVRGRTPIVDEAGKVRPYVWAARKRGVLFDVGHGGGSFLFRQAVPAMKQGFHPDVISTDLHTGSMNDGMKDILNTMSKFLNMGMSLQEVVRSNSSRAAGIIKRTDLGHLGVGAEADVAVLSVRRGTFGFLDVSGGKLTGTQKLECELTVKGGRVVWDLNGIAHPSWTEIAKPSPDSTPGKSPAAAGVGKRVIAPPGPKPVGPYSPGILAGDFLYVSGQGGRDAEGKLPATVEGQARQTLQNVKAIVEAAGLTLEHVVYSQVYLDDMANYEVTDRVWREFFPKASPARAVLGVYQLPTDIAVEINAVAFRDLSRRKLIVPAGHAANDSWTPGVMAGNRLYLSGFLGADAVTGKTPDDPDAQVQMALDNMKHTLAAAGMDFRHLVFVNPYLTGNASRRMNEIYAKHFELGDTPARATIRVASLPGGNTIELTGVAIADLSRRRAVRPKNMSPSATASPCVLADDTYYCSAKGPFTPGPGNLQGIYAATVEAQVRQTMRNLLDGLEEAGLALSNVVATNVYLDDMSDFSRMNAIYGQYFPESPPTRTTVSQIAPSDRKAPGADRYPALEQISLIAVK